MRLASVEHSGFLNDIISAGKEERLGCFHNAVHILRRRDGCSIEAAVQEVNAIATRCVQRFLDAEAAFSIELASAAVTDDDRAGGVRCAAGYRALLRGVYDWHLEVDRYSQAGQAMSDGPDYLEHLFTSDISSVV